MVVNENRNYIIPHTKVSMKTQNIPSGGTSSTFDNLFKGKLHDRIALAMVADAAATGCYNANPSTSKTSDSTTSRSQPTLN